MGRSKEDYERVEFAQSITGIDEIDGALAGIRDKIITEGTATKLTPDQREVLDLAMGSSYIRHLEEEQDQEDYINRQMEKDD